MNEIKLVASIKFDDEYVNAKNKLIEFIKSLNDLTDIQRKQLAQEFITSHDMATSFDQFVSYMNNGGQA